MKVVKLRDELRARGLATTGLKAALEERLEQARQAEKNGARQQQQQRQQDDEEEVEGADEWEEEE